jgi:capsular exopolysaccharide synthesis family protein
MKLFSYKPKKLRSEAPSRRALISDSMPFAVIESYKTTRTNLMFALSDKDKKWVTVTSALPGEGKTITCTNLAITFAQTGAKTLIIDADLRKPRIARTFDVPSYPGLSDAICGFCDLESIIHKTQIQNFFVIPAGTIPPNPAELLASDEMKKLLDSLSNMGFEYIFFDTPPINIVTDAAAITAHTAGTLLVVRSNVTTKESLQSAVSALNQAGIKILGFILNGVDLEKNSYRYGKYGKYGKYSSYGYSYGRNANTK